MSVTITSGRVSARFASACLPFSVAHVQVDDARLARHQSPDVCISGNPEQLVQRGLAGAMVADGQLAYSQNEVDVGDVAPHAPGQRRRRHVVASGIAPGAHPFGDQSSRAGHQLGR